MFPQYPDPFAGMRQAQTAAAQQYAAMGVDPYAALRNATNTTPAPPGTMTSVEIPKPQESGMKCGLGTLIFLGYIAGIFFTWAWMYETEGWQEPGLGSAVVAPAWPIYWAGKGALYIVRSARSSKSMMCKDAAGNVWKPTAEGFCVPR